MSKVWREVEQDNVGFERKPYEALFVLGTPTRGSPSRHFLVSKHHVNELIDHLFPMDRNPYHVDAALLKKQQSVILGAKIAAANWLTLGEGVVLIITKEGSVLEIVCTVISVRDSLTPVN